jgi:hypothetical protein
MRRRSGWLNSFERTASQEKGAQVGALFVVWRELWTTARILLYCMRAQRIRAASRYLDKQKINEFKMLLQTFAWHKESGWSAPLPAGMDSQATLAVMFGGNPVDACCDLHNQTMTVTLLDEA